MASKKRKARTPKAARTLKPKSRVALYAGSFDPVTMGHMYMIREGAQLFDKLIVAIGINPGKSYTFSLDERLRRLCQEHKFRPSFISIQIQGLSQEGQKVEQDTSFF